MATHDLYRRFSEGVAEGLEYGDLPWGRAGPETGRPLRYTGEPFGGAGVLAQWSTAEEKGFRLPTWMTFTSIEEHGGRLLDGAAAVTVFHGSTRPGVTVSESGETIVRGVETWRPYSVFNVEEVEGLPRYLYRSYQEIRPPSHPSTDQALADFAQAVGADVRLADHAVVADPEMDGLEEWRRREVVLELVGWTGHPARMNRRVQQPGADGGVSRVRETLVKEIGAAFLVADLGAEGIFGTWETRAWCDLLRNDEVAVFQVCRDASRAVDWLHRRAPGFRIDPGMSKSGFVLSGAGRQRPRRAVDCPRRRRRWVLAR